MTKTICAAAVALLLTTMRASAHHAFASEYDENKRVTVTRTFSMGRPDAEKRAVINAVMEASREAIAAVRPGITASTIDRAARQVLQDRGFGKAFKHATGHGVGFAAISRKRTTTHPPVTERDS